MPMKSMENMSYERTASPAEANIGPRTSEVSGVCTVCRFSIKLTCHLWRTSVTFPIPVLPAAVMDVL